MSTNNVQIKIKWGLICGKKKPSHEFVFYIKYQKLLKWMGSSQIDYNK